PAFTGACFLGSRGMDEPGSPRLRVASPGEESLAAAIAARRSRLCRPVARSSHQEAAHVARPTALWEKTWRTWPAQEAGFSGRKNRNPGVQKGGRSYPGPCPGARVADTGLSTQGHRCRLVEVLQKRGTV